jgi:oxalate decarboxylase
MSEPEVSRRALLGSAAATVGVAAATVGVGAANAAPAAAAPGGAEPAKDAPRTHKFRLAAQKANVFPGGNNRMFNVHNFPMCTDFSGGVMIINPGALRELHWHPNAAEWTYVLAGKVRLTVFSPKGLAGEAETVDLEPGDIAFIPRGYAHHVENPGPGEAQMLFLYNHGAFDTISSTGWFAATPKEVLAANFGVPEKTFADFPKQTVFIAPKPK